MESHDHITSPDVPADWDHAQAWAQQRGRSVEDGQRGLAIYWSLAAVAREPALRNAIFLHGSCAMWLAYGLPRVPRDLDLLVDVNRLTPARLRSEASAEFASRVNRALRSRVPEFCPQYERCGRTLRKLARVGLLECEMFFSEPPTCQTCSLTLLPAEVVGSAIPSVRLLPLPLLFASKLHALIRFPATRKSPSTDLFDCAYLIQRWLGDEEVDAVRSALERISNRSTPNEPSWLRAWEAHSERLAIRDYTAVGVQSAGGFIPVNRAVKLMRQYLMRLDEVNARSTTRV